MVMPEVNHRLPRMSTTIYLSQSTLVDMTVGQRLQRLREDAGLTLEQAGKIAGTTKQSTSQIEKGITKAPGGLFLYNWSKHYRVNLEWLITGKGDPAASQIQRPTPDTILAAVRLASGATTGVGLDSFEIETEADAELFALAIEEVLDDGITVVSDSDVQRFARKLQSRRKSEDGQIRKARPDGRANSATGKAEAGDAPRPAASPARKRAAGGTRG